jgi:hypothetical protein
MPDWYSVFKISCCDPGQAPKLELASMIQLTQEQALEFINSEGEEGSEYTIMPIYYPHRNKYGERTDK